MTYVVGDSFGDSPNKLTTGTRHLEQALRVDRPPSALSFATQDSVPATQGQRSRLGQGFCFRSDSGGCGAGFMALTARAQRGGGTLRWSGRGVASVLCASVPSAAQRSS
jgi:hypothetical protein